MAIKPLPEATVRLLGSTQALTTPTSLVKELVDNAIDAKATSIDIILSPNTLDKIEVRDNGHGIPQEDLDSLGKRGYTSKLNSFEELKSIGSISLGFRGEALFSAVQLGQVSVTSRCYGEEVATMVKLKPLGGIDTKISTSHPIGTTICVTNFLYSLPVRKQTSLKESPKTLGKIKELLRAYCLARPHIKVSLRVLKSTKGSWSFSPRPNDGMKEAVSQAISRDVATICMEKFLVFSDNSGYGTDNCGNNHEAAASKEPSSIDNQFSVDIFLPKTDADFSKVSYGQYISVDARPVSHEKGTMKKIVTIFKYYIKNSLSETISKISNPFLRLNIKCPTESYDPNVEPAKDDVIFVNEDCILKNIEEAFKNIYGEIGVQNNTRTDVVQEDSNNYEPLPNQELSPKNSELSVDNSAQGSISRKSESAAFKPLQLSSTSSHEGLEHKNSISKRAGRIDMSTNYNIHDIETPTRPKGSSRTLMPARTPESVPQSSDSLLLNPWLIAKKSALKQRKSSEDIPLSKDNFGQGLLLTPQPSLDLTMVNFEHDKTSRKKQKISRGFNDAPSETFSRRAPMNRSYSPPNTEPSNNASSDEDLFLPEKSTKPSYDAHGFISARKMNDLQTSSPESIGPKRQKIFNKPFISPSKKKQNPSPEKLYQTKLINKTSLDRDNLSNKSGRIEQDESDPDLIWTMDYENRKLEATRKHREKQRTAQLDQDLSTSSSHRKNKHNEVALALESLPTIYSRDLNSKLSPKAETSLPDNDPRGYFIRRRNLLLSHVGKVEGSKIGRGKTSRLPLERIPGDQELHECMTRVITGLDDMKRMVDILGESDGYIKRGSARESPMRGLDLKEEEKKELICVFQETIESWKENVMTSGGDIEYNFDNLIRAGGNIPT